MLMPMRLPPLSRSGPPLLPGFIAASVWITSCIGLPVAAELISLRNPLQVDAHSHYFKTNFTDGKQASQKTHILESPTLCEKNGSGFYEYTLFEATFWTYHAILAMVREHGWKNNQQHYNSVRLGSIHLSHWTTT